MMSILVINISPLISPVIPFFKLHGCFRYDMYDVPEDVEDYDFGFKLASPDVIEERKRARQQYTDESEMLINQVGSWVVLDREHRSLGEGGLHHWSGGGGGGFGGSVFEKS